MINLFSNRAVNSSGHFTAILKRASLITALVIAALLTSVGDIKASYRPMPLELAAHGLGIGLGTKSCEGPEKALLSGEVASLVSLSSVGQNEPMTVKPAPADFAARDFKVLSVGDDYSVVSWNTNAPSTSQVRVINPFTGDLRVTPMDHGLSLHHEMKVKGLLPASIASLQAVSTYADGITVAQSAVNTVKTAR